MELQIEVTIDFHFCKGKTGQLKFDDQGDRVGKYSVKHFQNGKWEEIATIESDGGQPFHRIGELDWNGEDKPPTDNPPCGYDGQICTREYNRYTGQYCKKGDPVCQ